jgi:hypothetical protein
MKPIEQLLLEAEQHRDADIEQAKVNYAVKVREIRALEQKLKRLNYPEKFGPRVLRLPKPGAPIRCMNALQAAHAILSEGKALTLVEIVVAMQERGCRSNDIPDRILRCIRESFRYHQDRFIEDCEGRWTVLQD